MYSGMYPQPLLNRVMFGQKFTDALQKEIQQHQLNSIFLMVSQSLINNPEVLDSIHSALGHHIAEIYTKIRAHTSRTDVVDAAMAAKKAKADLILTIGGGSITDAGKMIALCLSNDISHPEQLDRLLPKPDKHGGLILPAMVPPRIRLIAVPTTLSAGEFSNIAGVTDTTRNIKEVFKHRDLMPNLVVLDPWVTRYTPEWLFLSTGIRALDHAVETICSVRPTPISVAASLYALQLLGENLDAVKHNPLDFEARSHCQCATWLSMTGVQSEVPLGASHAIGHELGGTAGVPHGYTSCVMLPHVLRFNSQVNSKQQELISNMLGQPQKAAAEVVAELITRLGLPTRLRDVGVTETGLDDIAAHSMLDPWIFTNPREIPDAVVVRQLLDAAW